MEIVQLTSVDEKACAEINALLKQLGDKQTSIALLKALVATTASELWVSKEDGVIVGMATIALIVKTTGITAAIEGVVVDEAQRGKGIGKQLCEKLIERARALGAGSIHLTSRPARVAANALYKKMGFELKETNVYRMQF